MTEEDAADEMEYWMWLMACDKAEEILGEDASAHEINLIAQDQYYTMTGSYYKP